MGIRVYCHRQWTKPTLLRGADFLRVTVKPLPEDEYCLMCEDCTNLIAARICEFCGKILCSGCVATHNHYDSSGSGQLDSNPEAANRTACAIPMCSECGYQLATKHCRACRDKYCDSCFKHVHKSFVVTHGFEPLVEHCQMCLDSCARYCGGANSSALLQITATQYKSTGKLLRSEISLLLCWWAPWVGQVALLGLQSCQLLPALSPLLADRASHGRRTTRQVRNDHAAFTR